MKRLTILAPTLALVVIASALAQSRATPPTQPGVPPSPATDGAMKPMLTLSLANRVMDAAIAEAHSLDAGGAIAIVDDGGYLILLTRLDNTFPAGAEVSTLKARTAAIFRKPTQDFENAIKNGRTPLLGVQPMTPLEGGVPIVIDGQVVGAVGVSGAHSSTEDVRIATAAARALAD